jgi:hypothetical protein
MFLSWIPQNGGMQISYRFALSQLSPCNTWNGNIAIEDFTITFTGLPRGVQITNLELGPTCGTGSQTVFCAAASGVLMPWMPVAQ